MTGPKKNQLNVSPADGTPESGLALWSPFSRQHLSTHVFSSFVSVLCSPSPSPSSHSPIRTSSPSVLHTPCLLSWKASVPSSWTNGPPEMTVQTWIRSGLGRIQGENMASLGIPFHQVKRTQKRAFVTLSGKSCLHAGSEL